MIILREDFYRCLPGSEGGGSDSDGDQGENPLG